MTDESTIMSGLTSSHVEGSCYSCSKKGQPSSRFPEKSKSEWAANKTKEVIHAQQILNQATSDNQAVGSAKLSKIME